MPSYEKKIHFEFTAVQHREVIITHYFLACRKTRYITSFDDVVEQQTFLRTHQHEGKKCNSLIIGSSDKEFNHYKSKLRYREVNLDKFNQF